MYRIFIRICILFISVLIISPENLKGQEFKLFDINTDEYPVISAKFVFTDIAHKKVTNLTKEEITLSENNSDREIIYLKNPEIKAMPLSILLVFDISGSMRKNRMNIAKEAAKGLLNEVDLNTTEIAISTFNYSAFLNCDFTNDSARLISTINTIEPEGGTSYEEAFLSDLTGGIEIAKQGKHNKIIIFMTDGLGNINQDDVIDLSKKEDITIFSTTIELDMPPVLKNISQETNGYSFANINDPRTSRTIYSKLYRDIVATEYGVIKWMASDDCEEVHDIVLKTRGLITNTSFELPVDPIEGLVVLPSSLFVRSQEKDSLATKYVRIASPHKPITIVNIKSTNPDRVMVEVPELPLELKPGDNYQLKIDYAVKGLSDELHQIKIYTENCLKRNSIDIQYGVPGKIDVIKPSGGDIYGSGMDTLITWGGISKSQPVSLYYKYGNTNWQKISETNGLKYIWETPLDTSSSYQVMAKPADDNDFTKKYEIPGQMRDVRIMDVSNDGNLFITRDVVGLTSVWQDGNPRPVKVFRNPASRFIYFSEDDLYLIDYNTNTIIIRNVFTNSKKGPIYDDNLKVYSANATLYGDEYLLSADVLKISQTESVFNDAVNSNLLFKLEHGENTPLYAAKCANAPLVLIMNQDYSLDIHNLDKGRTKRLTRRGEVVTKAYINPNGKFVYVEEADWKGIIETDRGRPVVVLKDENYIRFSPDGDRLLTLDKNRNLTLWDLNNQIKVGNFKDSRSFNFLESIPNARFFNFSYKGNIFYTAYNNNVTLFDINKGQFTHKIITEEYIKDISISQDGSEILVTSNGQAEIYDCFSGGLKFTVVDQSSPIIKAVYANNSKIITISQDRSISIWEPSISPEAGLSGEFRIVSPLPEVTPQYDIGVEIVGQKKEVVLENFITNNSQFPIRILNYDWEAFTENYELISNPPPFTLNPQESVDAEIRFSPTDTIKYPTSIFVITPGGDVQSKILGNGINKMFELPKKIIDFGKIELEAKIDTTVTLLKNISNDVIVIKDITNSGPDKKQFSILTNINNVSLKPSEVLNVKLEYSALQRGRTSGGLKITINEQIFPVQLFGEGLGAREVFVRGKTIDQDSVAIQSNVICTEIDKAQQHYNKLTDTSGRFNITFSKEGSYILYAEKDGYISASENLNISQPFKKDTIDVTIMLSKVEQGSLFRLNGVFFKFAKAELISSSKTDLDRVLQLLQGDKKIRIEIHGHTDEIGTEESNIVLSKARANAVKNYLVEHGISEERLTIQFFGETKPIANNETDEGRQLNRRVEFLIKE